MATIGLYIINYNCGKFLISAIYSVLRQTSKYDEFVIYDNNSSEKLSSIVLQNAENIGLKVVRLNTNNLVETATRALNDIQCDYLFRIDGDDILKRNAIEVYRDVIKNHKKLALIIPSYKLISHNCVLLGKVGKNLETNMPMFPPHGAITLVNREAFLALGGYYSGFDKQDGYMLWLRFYKAGLEIKVLMDILFLYRQHRGSLSNNRLEILAKRYLILEEAVSLCTIDFSIVFYGLPGENMNPLINKFSELISLAKNAYLHYNLNLEHSNLKYVQREIFGNFHARSFFDDYNLKSCKYNIFVSPNFSGSAKSVCHCLMTAKITDERRVYVLAERINTDIYVGFSKLRQISFGENLFNENPIFVKYSGMEIYPQDVNENDENFIVEYKI